MCWAHSILPSPSGFAGAEVVMVATTQSADLRKYYSKHAKNDRIDSELLARLPAAAPGRIACLQRATPS